MKKLFVEGLSNEARFLTAMQAIEHRGAVEASWVLIGGDPGFGKTNLLMRHSLRSGGVFIRCSAKYTVKWILTDLADVLNVERRGTSQQLSEAIIAELMKRQARPGFAITVDEINHAARDEEVLETLRTLTDKSECVLIAGGMKGVHAKLKNHKQILSRIDQYVEFTPATVDDVAKMCAALSEVTVADDLIEAIQKRTEGRLRNVMGAIARVEAYGKRNRFKEVTLAGYGQRPLLSDDRPFPTAITAA